MAIASTSCGHAKSEQNSAISKADTSVMTDIPDFDADSAYAFIDAQVAFGPRVPGTPAHEKCENYIVSSLRKFGADTVSVQRTTVTAFDGTRLPVANIMASFNNGAPRKGDGDTSSNLFFRPCSVVNIPGHGWILEGI